MMRGGEKVAQKMKKAVECWVFVSARLLWETGLEEDKRGAGLVWDTGEKLVPHFQSETGLKK